MRRYDWLREIRRLDPERDFLRIYRITVTHEFPWDVTRALELALYRTYAVPGIGRLLAATGELTDRAQKRYDDTVLLLDTIVEHGFRSDDGRTAIRRINGMHRAYDIGNDDMRYVLSTFVAMPIRWIDRYGWRRLSTHEKRAIAAYYGTLGRHMGITGIPRTHQEFAECLDSYEAAHFGWDPEARRVADASLELMARWYGPLAPVVRGASLALLDDALLDAFRYDRPRPAVRTAVHTALKLRAKAVRLLPPRRTPHYARQNPEVKSYPNGYRIADLGTFPASRRLGACPVHPVAGDAATEDGPAAAS
ncbi:peptidase [Streptomyces sp. NRRL F-4489]|uniref:oxygenase MpaB family protein n=1 Tax=Streptomyces sp. NRRL F-4489 TaxID=1609095 RepID=UPI00074A4653|nr:oxygenase MpaB family protein [Streptomyces sp. NRRL F-4489]KUL35068.1 peptidase [Streptomyces sp. NRRL F-4489]